MGITNPTFPTEVLPQGNAIPAGADQVADPEDATGAAVTRLTNFMKLMAAPVPLSTGTTQARTLFANTGCASCHTPTMNTGPNSVAALANKPVDLYSDLLLHDMGAQLGDGIRQGLAGGTEFRTAPLWGIRFRRFLLSDGRAQNVDQAIRLHGGEATNSVTLYNALTAADRNVLLTFVQGL